MDEMDFNHKEKKINEFLVSQKYQGELKGNQTLKVSYTHITLNAHTIHSLYAHLHLQLAWPMISPYGMQYLIAQSESFSITNDDKWMIIVRPIGMDEGSEFMSVHLRNVSKGEVFASYKITLINQAGRANIEFEDPEKLLSFAGAGSCDSEWGNDEFIRLNQLYEGCDWVSEDGEMEFKVDIEIYGREDLISNTDIGSIEKKNLEGDLISMANTELLDVIKRLPIARYG